MSRPFDKARYEALLEGLEISEVLLSGLDDGIRVDAELYKRKFAKQIKSILRMRHTTFAKEAKVVKKGIFDINSSFYTDDGVPFVRISDLKDMQIDTSSITFIPESENQRNLDTALIGGDIVLSKTAYPAASVVTLDRCNVSQDTVAVKLKADSDLLSHYVVVFLNTEIGKAQMLRRFTGNIQMHLNLTDCKEKVLIPVFSCDFQSRIKGLFTLAIKKQEASEKLLAEAEQTLLAALGLKDWQPPEPLTYTCSSKDVLDAGRFDSQYFAPRVAQLLARLGKDGLTVRDVAPPRSEKFAPASEGTFRYIEISDLQSNGTTACETINMQDAPSRATWTVRSGDVLTSTVRPNRRLSALVTPEQDGCVASSGFVVLQPMRVAAEVLLTYLRLPVFCELMDLHTSASLYPAISDRDLLALPFPKIAHRVSDEIVAAVRSAHDVRRQAQALLARAQRAVEIAIEEGEAAGMRCLEGGERVERIE